jgi:hypothetical protein
MDPLIVTMLTERSKSYLPKKNMAVEENKLQFFKAHKGHTTRGAAVAKRLSDGVRK